jgi:hypothetical protein
VDGGGHPDGDAAGARDREPVRRPEKLLLVVLAPAQAVVGRRRDEKHRSQRSCEERDHERELL